MTSTALPDTQSQYRHIFKEIEKVPDLKKRETMKRIVMRSINLKNERVRQSKKRKPWIDPEAAKIILELEERNANKKGNNILPQLFLDLG